MRFQICMHLHAMSDFGSDGKGGYSRSITNNAECYLLLEGKPCPYRGRCLIAEVPKKPRREEQVFYMRRIHG